LLSLYVPQDLFITNIWYKLHTITLHRSRLSNWHNYVDRGQHVTTKPHRPTNIWYKLHTITLHRSRLSNWHNYVDRGQHVTTKPHRQPTYDTSYTQSHYIVQGCLTGTTTLIEANMLPLSHTANQHMVQVTHNHTTSFKVV